MVGEATVVVVVLLLSEGDVAVLESSHPAQASASRTKRAPVTASGRRVSVLDVTSWGHGRLARRHVQAARLPDLTKR